MPPISLKPERARALRLAAHHLTDDAPAPTLVAAAAVAGCQDTPPGSGALGLAARVPDAFPEDVEHALTEERSIVNVWSRRGSPLLVPAEDLGIFTRGLLPDDEESWRTAIAGFVGHLDTVGMTATELVALVEQATVEALDGRELTKRELGEALRPKMPPQLKKWFDADTFSSFTAVLTRAASLYGSFLISPRHGEEATFVRTDQWLGAAPMIDPEDARLELTRRYLRAYGPSLPKAYAEWGGIGEGHARRVWQRLADELVAVRIEGADGQLLADDLARIDDIPGARGVRLLPPHDAYLGAIDRRVIVPELAWHKKLWRSQGNPGAVLFDGEIAAGWRARKAGQRLIIEIEQYRTLPQAAHRAIEAAAPRLTLFKGMTRVEVHFSM